MKAKIKWNLLSYTTVIIRLSLIIIAIWLLHNYLWNGQPKVMKNGVYAVLRVALIIFCICQSYLSTVEFYTTYTNRKYKKIKELDLRDIPSRHYEYSKLMSILKKHENIFIIVKNSISVFKIGHATIYGTHFTDIRDSYFYIEEIVNNRINRIKYHNIRDFKHVIRELNNDRDLYDVVSIDKIKLPKKQIHRS